MRISDWSSDVCSSDLQNSDMKFVLVTFSVSIVFAAKDSALPGCSHRIPGQFHAVPPPCAFAAFNEAQGSGRSGFPVHGFPERGVGQTGGEPVLPPVTNPHLVSRLLLEKKKYTT